MTAIANHPAAAVSNPARSPKIVQKGTIDHISDWFDTNKGLKDFLKAIGLYGDWVKVIFKGQLSETGQGIQTAAKDGKRLLGAFEIVPKLNKVKAELIKEKRSLTEIFFSAIDCIGSVWDGFEFMHLKKIFVLPSESFKAFFGVYSVALAVGHSRNTYKDGVAIKKHAEILTNTRPDLESDLVRRKGLNDQVEFSRHFIAKKTLDFIKSISFVALGVIGTLTAFFALVIAPWAAVIASTSTCVFAISGHFTDKIWKISERAPGFIV